MAVNYPHMLSPIKVGNKVLKNRLLSSCCMPHFLSGPERWIPEAGITFFENLARSGAALVTVRDQGTDTSKIPAADISHTPWWDLHDKGAQNYHSQLCERVHFQGSLISMMFMLDIPMGYDVCAGPMMVPQGQDGDGPEPALPDPNEILKGIDDAGPAGMPPMGGKLPPLPDGVKLPEGMELPPMPDAPDGAPGADMPPMMAKELTPEIMHRIAKQAGQKARFYQSLGFDAVTLHMAYQAPGMGKFISALTNRRTDEYGGSMENRARFPLEVIRAIKEACGKDFIVEVEISGEEGEGGNTIEDVIAFAKLSEDCVDIIQLRCAEIDPSHPVGYSYTGIPKTLEYAAALKKAGVRQVVSPAGGFGDYDLIENSIAEGKCDAVDMARAFMVEPEYARKAAEGRAEDRIPCVRCNKCHHIPKDKWVTICSVNPMLGLAHHEKAMVRPPVRKKNIAVIGGGPAGMRAAMFAQQRGHTVTIYEKGDKLGGQLLHADYPSFKWPLRDYKDYLALQVNKLPGVTVLMNTEATPEMIAEKGYDAVIVAIGSEPKRPNIPGADTVDAYAPIDVYGHEQELGKRVVVVGGGATGTETGMYLAECGHDVTVLTRSKILAKDEQGMHFYSMMKTRWESYPNFTGIVNAATTKVENGKVTYVDDEGEHVLECDSIVLSGGVQKRDDLVMAFYGTAPEVVTCGDCREVGALPTVNYTAYSAASRL